MLLWWSIFTALLPQKEELTSRTKPLGSEACSFMALREETKISCQSLMMWLNYLTMPFQDKVKCRSHCGPQTSQINRITEKEWPFFMEKRYDFPPSSFFPAAILKAFIRETLVPEWKSIKLAQKLVSWYSLSPSTWRVSSAQLFLMIILNMICLLATFSL